jgi:3alpha(or 20beta)-hydroxysteroid dehydrogenase
MNTDIQAGQEGTIVGKLDGKVAIITGAARGQGEAAARQFVAEGAQVVLADVLDDLGERVAIELGEAAVYVHLDVTNGEQWKQAVGTALARFGKLDILVNNAGIVRTGLIESQPLDEYLAVINVNQVGCWLGMQAVIPSLKANGGGTIVNTSSIAGFLGAAGTSAYVASKFAVRGMTKCAAVELGEFNIRVNSVHPGLIDTPMVRNRDVAGATGPRDAMVRGQPIGRIGRPEEVAAMIVFLASDATYSTGSEFILDGGQMAGLARQLD